MKSPAAAPTFRAPDPGRRACPQCQGPLSRVSRRWIDRLSSLFHPVQRFRCRSPACGWVGNLAPAPGRPVPSDRTPL